jgi:CheY-like chemotaxis protein
MLLFIVAIVLFVIADIAIRAVSKHLAQKKARTEREAALAESVTLDFTREATSLKILVLDGYAVDTVESGKEALGLIQTHNYDFVFTDLKMPEMDGVEVTKSVKHIRPDIDVIIITGYATVETAVETMKHGAMDYVQKPFTEDELLAFVKKSLLRREDRIQKMLQPQVHITHLSAVENVRANEFAIPGGVFIAPGHCWAAVEEDGAARIGIDDFAAKLFGRIDGIELPNLGMAVKRGQPLFTVRKGNRRVTFRAPLGGKVVNVKSAFANATEALEKTPYENNWICIIDTDQLDAELTGLKIGNSAVGFYREELERFRALTRKMTRTTAPDEEGKPDTLYTGELADFSDRDYQEIVSAFFER